MQIVFGVGKLNSSHRIDLNTNSISQLDDLLMPDATNKQQTSSTFPTIDKHLSHLIGVCMKFQ